MLGYPASVRGLTQQTSSAARPPTISFSVQNDYRVSDRLTLNLGLRYEYSPWMSPYRNQMGTFDPAMSKPIMVSGHGSTVDLSSQYAAPVAYQYFGNHIQTSSQAGIPYNITHTDKTQFAPRLAWPTGLRRQHCIPRWIRHFL